MGQAGSQPVPITNTSVCAIVGQKIDLSVKTTPDPGGLVWRAPVLPGQAVENYTQSLDAGVVTPYFAGGNTCDPISFAWVAETSGPVTVHTMSWMWDSYDLSASFDVISPQATFGSTTNPAGVTVGRIPIARDGAPAYSATALHFGKAFCIPDSSGIIFNGQVTSPQGGGGDVAIVQLIRRTDTATTRHELLYSIGSHGAPVLDNSIGLATPQNFHWQIDGDMELDLATESINNGLPEDSPYDEVLDESIKAVSLTQVTMDASFQTYLMYKPDGTGSIWVTLDKLTWNVSGTAIRTGPLRNGNWILKPGSSVVNPANSEGQSDLELPQWNNRWSKCQAWRLYA